jgi:DNA repair photolyase
MEYIPAKTIVSRTKGDAWFGVQYNMNIYRGCPHGCIYCDSRSLCYQIEQFDRVRAKVNALQIIRGDLLKKRKKGIVASGAMSDPYNPYEKDLLLTRGALELLHTFRFGAAIASKSALVSRDAAILQKISGHSPVIVNITITAADDTLSALVEPNAPPSSKRFETIRYLREKGIFAGVLMMPVLPFIEDTEENITAIIHNAKESGASFIYPSFGLTLRDGNREYYYAQLDRHFPGIKEKYLDEYGERYWHPSPDIQRLKQLFENACEEHGLLYKMEDIIRAYTKGYEDGGPGLFEET